MELNRLVEIGRDQCVPIGTKGNGENSGSTAHLELLLAPPINLPDFHTSIEASRRQPLSIRSKGDGFDSSGVPGQGAHFAFAGRIPKLDGVVRASGSQQLTVRTEGDAVHSHSMTSLEDQFRSDDWFSFAS